jgi:phosphoglycolate phosphatase
VTGTGSARDAPAITLAALDMAGTTVADDGVVERSFIRALGEVGIAEDDPDMPGRLAYVQSTMGRSKIEVFRGLLHDEARAQAATHAFEASIADLVRGGGVRPVPGAVETFAALRARGVAVCLTTGFSAETQQLIVATLGWVDRVDLVLAPGPGVRGRPHPDLVLTAVLRLGIDDVRAVAVAGDTASDLLAGTRAGAGVVAGVLTGAHGRAELEAAPHTHVLDSIAELPAIL